MTAHPPVVSERDLTVLRSFARRIDPSDAGAHNNLGVLYFQKGLVPEAIEQFTRALELDPRMQVAQRNLEISYHNTGYYDRRVAELQERLRGAPDERDARWELGRTYAILGAYDDAVTEFEELLAHKPKDVATIIQLGLAEKARGRLELATEWFLRAAEAEPDSSVVHFYLGEVYYNRGLNEPALTALERAVSVNPDNANAHYLMAFVLGDMGRHQDARAASKRAIQLNPPLARAQTNLSLERYRAERQSAEHRLREQPAPEVAEGSELAHFNLGLAFRQKGYYTEALREYRLAIERGEDRRLVRQAMAEVHLLKRDFTEALDLYESLIHESPESPKLWNERGVVLHQSGKTPEALGSYQQATEVDPRYALAWNNVGVVLAHQSGTDEAIEAFRKALQLAPQFVAARLNLALLLTHLRRFQLALEAYRQVLAEQPASAPAWNGVGLVLVELKRFQDARNAFVRAVEADPQNAGAHYNLSFTLSNLGDYDGALRATKRALELDPYYVSQKFALAIDLQYETVSIGVVPEISADVSAENLGGEASSDPANGAGEVPVGSDVTVTFSEPVAVGSGWYSISCSSSGPHSATESGGPQTFLLNPDTDFAQGETCTMTVDATKVTDVDTDDPPDQMAANQSFTFTTTLPLTEIAQVQGAGQLSPLTGKLVKVEGVVTAERGSNVWVQDTSPDADPATSDAILVFGSSVASAVVVGDRVQVRGTVSEFRSGCTPSCAPDSSAFDNLTITELAAPGLGVTVLGTAPLPAATVIGIGGRVPPTETIENDSATGNVETSNVFDPAQDGIDFDESLESMLVQVNAPVVVGPRNGFGELLVLGDNGASAGVRTARGGVIVRPSDFNPERIMLDDLILPTPPVDVGDHFTTSAVGVMTYDFANYKIAVTQPLTPVDGGLQQEVTALPRENELAVATFNVENLAPTDPPDKFQRLAGLIVDHLRAPDVIAIEEIQDNDGVAGGTASSVVDASVTWGMLIDAIEAAGGPRYQYRQIDPQDDSDGGAPGGNIRVGFLFRTDRGLAFVDRPGGNGTTPTQVVRQGDRAHLTLSPGRVDPLNPAWADTRKPLAGEFVWNGKTVIVIANHFSSKGGDDPLYGRFQPPVQSSAPKRHEQAASVNSFVRSIVAAEAKANVVVLGDINDFDFSETTQILESGKVLSSLMHGLPQSERYSYVFEGNSQVLDQILFSPNMLRGLSAYDVVHVNSEFADQASDHDPSVARTKVLGGGG